MPDLKPVKSSNVRALHYDEDAQDLHIEFKNGGRYIIHGVPKEHGSSLHTQESIGGYFHKHIKPHYKSTKVG